MTLKSRRVRLPRAIKTLKIDIRKEKTMKKTLKNIFIIAGALVLALAMGIVSWADADLTKTASQEICKRTESYFSELVDAHGLSVGSTGGEWIVIGLARSKAMTQAQKENYCAAAYQFVTENANANEQLHRAKSTENSRIILALTAIGEDVTNVEGHNLLKGLSDQKYLEKQGINGPIWALIALDSHNYEIPAVAEGGTQASRGSIIQYILDKQLDNGGWALAGNNADPDMTAMALQSLAPYYGENAEVTAAVETALIVLSNLQQDNGGYSSVGMFGGVPNCESSAQVVTALTALNIDPNTDTRFVKNGHSLLSALCDYALADGGFSHTADGQFDAMASEQGYYALVSYLRFINEESGLYDMTDVTIGDPNAGTESQNPSGSEGDSSSPSGSEGEGSNPSGSEGESNNPSTGEPASTNGVICLIVLSSAFILGSAAHKRKIISKTK